MQLPSSLSDPTSYPAKDEPPLAWHDVQSWGVEGRAWTDLPRKGWYDRLPAEAEGKVPAPVWDLSRHSAGLMVRFKTDADPIWVRYTVRQLQLTGSNMTAIASSGLDLYARDDNNRWRWAGLLKPECHQIRAEILSKIMPGFREYALYLPLFNEIEDLYLGVPPTAKFEKLAPRAQKPILFYGTSITHGASASRPGMTHVAILGRRFDCPVLNLGFSGNGRMDESVGDLLVKLDPAVYVVDCAPNMDAPMVRSRCPHLVRQLRAARPATPIVLVEDRRNANSWILPERDRHHTDNHAAMRECFEALQAEGISKLYYLPGDDLIGHDAEGTTDGSHPNDLGFVRQADVFEPVLRGALRLPERANGTA